MLKSIKILSILLLLVTLYTGNLMSQDAVKIQEDKIDHKETTEKEVPKACYMINPNMIKFDLPALVQNEDISLAFERGINQTFSFQVGTKYLGNKMTEANEAEMKYSKSFGMGFQAEVRHYLLSLGSPMPMNGLYYGPYASYQFRNKQYVSYNSSIAFKPFDQKLQERQFEAGLKVGYQQHLYKGFYLDGFVGYGFESINTKQFAKDVPVMFKSNEESKTGTTDLTYQFQEVADNKTSNLGANAGVKLSFRF